MLGRQHAETRVYRDHTIITKVDGNYHRWTIKTPNGRVIENQRRNGQHLSIHYGMLRAVAFVDMLVETEKRRLRHAVEDIEEERKRGRRLS